MYEVFLIHQAINTIIGAIVKRMKYENQFSEGKTLL